MSMKKLLLMMLATILVSAFSAFTLVNDDNPLAAGMAKFKWENTTHDFGKINKNDPVEHKFEFKNVGDSPLVISNVRPSCGCTVTKYTKKPVPPGKTGYVKATYDTKRMGMFNKSIRVTANIEGGAETLMIKGEVVAPTEEAKSE